MEEYRKKQIRLSDWLSQSIREFNEKDEKDFITFETRLLDLELGLTDDYKNILYDLYEARPRVALGARERRKKVITSVVSIGVKMTPIIG